MDYKVKIAFLLHVISFLGLFLLLFRTAKKLIIMEENFSLNQKDKITLSFFNKFLKLFNYLFNEPAMKKSERALFYKYLDLSHVYFEFGSGGSTYQAAKRNKKIYSVESDVAWHQKIQRDMKNISIQINEALAKNNIKITFNPDITYLTIDLHVGKKRWGWPGKDTKYDDWIKYTRAYDHSKYKADLILIDGRFRVACGLNVFKQIDNNVLVYIHDFFNRNQYHILLNYFDVADRADTSVVLRKKTNPPYLPEDLLNKYENTPSAFTL